MTCWRTKPTAGVNRSDRLDDENRGVLLTANPHPPPPPPPHPHPPPPPPHYLLPRLHLSLPVPFFQTHSPPPPTTPGTVKDAVRYSSGLMARRAARREVQKWLRSALRPKPASPAASPRLFGADNFYIE